MASIANTDILGNDDGGYKNEFINLVNSYSDLLDDNAIEWLYSKVPESYRTGNPSNWASYWHNAMHGDNGNGWLKNEVNNYFSSRIAANKKAQQEQKAVTDARESTISEREASAKNAYTQARNNGQGRGLAASIGNAPLSGATASNYANSYNNLSNLGQSTQNDYLQKMGYVNALNQQADNLEKNAGWNILGAAIGGAGSGAQIGNSLFGGMGSKGDSQ